VDSLVNTGLDWSLCGIWSSKTHVDETELSVSRPSDDSAIRNGAPVWVMDSSHWTTSGPGLIVIVETLAILSVSNAPHGPCLMPVSELRGWGQDQRE
jgi:hypothetical protein